MNPGRKIMPVIFVLFLCLSLKMTNAQRIFINSPSLLYEVTGGIGNCNYTPIPLCDLIQRQSIYSIAFHKGNLYVLTPYNSLYVVDMNNPGNCTHLTNLPGVPGDIPALTVDKKGVLWGIQVSALALFSYDPSTNQLKNYGRVPQTPSGDLVFYHDKLLYAASDSKIYEVNVQQPEASTVFMSTQPYTFFGIIAFPDQCDKNKLYGIASSQNLLIELDMENRTVIGPLCSLPANIYDAGSEVEDGNTVGVTINAVHIKAPCLPSENTGDVKIEATTAGIGSLTYMLDNNTSNNTGDFPGLSLGRHTVTIANSLGCTTDTTFIIGHGVQAPLNITVTDPPGCVPDGSITITATSPYPLSYSLNNGVFQYNNKFADLAAGVYQLQVKDEGGCTVDTSVTLKILSMPAYVRNIETASSICGGKTGYIKTTMPAGTLTSLNNSEYSLQQQYMQLAAGSYSFSIKYDGTCVFDTTIKIEEIREPDPVINIIKQDQLCNENNGMVQLTITGPGSPYSSSINNGSFSTANKFEGLGPGTHTLQIQSSNKCEWQTTAEILPYLPQPFNKSFTIQQPNCEILTNGRLNIQITGTQDPYYVSLNGRTYPPGPISNLTAGDYELKWYNRDHCVLGTEPVKLVNTYSPVCDSAVVPSAFTPNGDGLNDEFKPVLGSPVTSGYTLTIYNRYGEMIYRNKSGRGWDGTYKNVRQDTGIYVWMLEYRDFAGNIKTQKGTVTLIR